MATNLVAFVLEHKSSGEKLKRILTVKVVSKLFFTTAFMSSTTMTSIPATSTEIVEVTEPEPWFNSQAKELLVKLLMN